MRFQLTLVVFSVLIHLYLGFFVSRRRRAPQPVKQDCSLSEWRTVADCSEHCGPDGIEKQERSIIIEGRNGGKRCTDYILKREVPCNRVCYNDGKIDEATNTCVCGKGWADKCCATDIDECKQSTKVCDKICKNEIGSYHCECPPSYTLDTDDKTCIDIKECQKKPAPCAHRCKELPTGGHQCYCNDGYQLADDSKSCNDIDECKTGSVCQFKCNNIPGDYECECANGYYRNSDNKTCTDIDECATLNGGCKHECENTIGGYRCKCTQGYNLADNGVDCIDIDECKILGDNICEQLCVNILGSYRCDCVFPFVLNSDLRTCTCASTDSDLCKSAEKEASAQKSDDNDKIYNWVIGGLLCVVIALFVTLTIVCMRRGYHRLYPPKPPPISTIPRFNNSLFNSHNALGDDDSGSGIYAEPVYADPIISPEYTDMTLDKSKDPEYMAEQPGPAENLYENKYSQRHSTYETMAEAYEPIMSGSNDVYEPMPHEPHEGPHDQDDPNIAHAEYSRHGGFDHESDYENNPPLYNNV